MAPIAMDHNKASIRPQARFLDRLGIGLAGLCALHCVATVVVVSVLGLGGHFLAEPAIHRVGLALALAVAAVGIGSGAFMHRRAAPLVVAGIGIMGMGAALVVPHGNIEIVLTIAGVVLVSLGHVMNLRHGHLDQADACAEAQHDYSGAHEREQKHHPERRVPSHKRADYSGACPRT